MENKWRMSCVGIMSLCPGSPRGADSAADRKDHLSFKVTAKASWVIMVVSWWPEARGLPHGSVALSSVSGRYRLFELMSALLFPESVSGLSPWGPDSISLLDDANIAGP